VPFNDFFHAVSGQGPTTFQSSGTRFILGGTVELHLPAGLGLEADALYRNFEYNASVNGVDTLLRNRANDAWEFPLLVKYRLPGPFVRPFLGAGVAWDRWSGYKQLTSPLGRWSSCRREFAIRAGERKTSQAWEACFKRTKTGPSFSLG